MLNWHLRLENRFVIASLLQILLFLFWIMLPTYDDLDLYFLRILTANDYAVIAPFLLFCAVLNVAVILVIIGPLLWLEWFRPLNAKFWVIVRIVSLVIGGNFFWIFLHSLNTPTLFMNSLFIHSASSNWSIPITIARFGGPYTVAAILGGMLGTLFYRWQPKFRAISICLLYYSTLTYLMINGIGKKEFSLTPGSTVLFYSDSWRADRFDARWMPSLTSLAIKHQAGQVTNVLTPSTRTTPSLAAFFTGKLPGENGILNMFASPLTLDPRKTRITRLREAGFCTIAIAEFPGDFLRRHDFGFEIVDAPLVTWPTLLRQIFLKKDPFILSTLSHYELLRFTPAPLRNAMMGLFTYSDPDTVKHRFQRSLSHCGQRPVFAFLFTGITHMPYIQRWPFYTPSTENYYQPWVGRVSWWRDATDDQLRQADEWLYNNAIRAFDLSAASFVKDWFAEQKNTQSTLVFSSDHGEYLHDGVDFSGHGNRLEHIEGLTVPWIVFGAKKDDFQFQDDALVSSLELSDILFGEKSPSSLPRNIPYTETEIWFEKVAAPADRLPYPEEIGLFEVEKNSKFPIVKKEYLDVTEAAKNRLWFIGGKRLELRPGNNETKIFLDSKIINIEDVPFALRPEIRERLKKIDHVRRSINVKN